MIIISSVNNNIMIIDIVFMTMAIDAIRTSENPIRSRGMAPNIPYPDNELAQREYTVYRWQWERIVEPGWWQEAEGLVRCRDDVLPEKVKACVEPFAVLISLSEWRS